MLNKLCLVDCPGDRKSFFAFSAFPFFSEIETVSVEDSKIFLEPVSTVPGINFFVQFAESIPSNVPVFVNNRIIMNWPTAVGVEV